METPLCIIFYREMCAKVVPKMHPQGDFRGLKVVRFSDIICSTHFDAKKRPVARVPPPPLLPHPPPFSRFARGYRANGSFRTTSGFRDQETRMEHKEAVTVWNTKKIFWNTMKLFWIPKKLWNPKKLPCTAKTLLPIRMEGYGTQGSYSRIQLLRNS